MQRYLTGRSLTLCAATLAISHLALPGLAIAATSADTRYQEALDGVLADAANPEKSFELVEAAIAAGDLRGAAAALERILLIDPRLANIRLELGVLYLRMGNGLLAQYHIREALRAPNVPQTVRLRAERLLAQAGGEASRSTFRFETSLGWRHDSNANAGPNADAVYVLDPFTFQPVLASLGSGGETSDTSIDAALRVSHSYAFEGRRGSSWDTDFTGYFIRYADLDFLDQYSLGLETGPTLVVGGSSDAPITVRPFVRAGTAYLDGDGYFDQKGGGVSLSAFWSPATVTQVRVAIEDRQFEDSPQRFLSDRSGDYLSGELRQIWQIGRLQLSAAVNAQEISADTDYQSYSYVGGGVGARYFGTTGFSQRPWNVYLDAEYGKAEYDAPDVLVHPDIVRDDDRLVLSAGVEFSLTRSLSVSLDLTHFDNDSSLPNYQYDNFSAAVRAVVRF